jgi:hypothetical protein
MKALHCPVIDQSTIRVDKFDVYNLLHMMLSDQNMLASVAGVTF